MPGFRKPLDVAGYIEALGDDEVELKHVMQLSERGRWNGDEPYKWPGDGEAFTSSSGTLARRDDIVWDANGYYAALGFTGGYRSITKKQLRVAYRELLDDPDVDRVWVTYCFKQLINPKIRAQYDAVPLGEQLFDDYWEEFYKQKANEQVAEQRRFGNDISIEDILAQWGLHLVDETEQGPPDMDWASAEDMPEKPKKVIESEWDWAFYVQDARSVNLYYMELWQKLVIEALRTNRQFGKYVYANTRFAVGVMGHSQTADTPRAKYGAVMAAPGVTDFVFYVRSDVKPTNKDAELVVKKLIESLRTGHNTQKFLKVRGQPARV